MAGTWTIAPAGFDEVAALAQGLGVSETLAAVLVRRGYREASVARAFLDPERPGHDPLLLGDMEAAVIRIRAAVAAGETICVHGDYDVDGICATALAVLTLRELGANVRWHLPSRFEEGYGVSDTTIASLAQDGVGLVLTVDCGITAAAEVAHASSLGLDVIVTDHHRPADTLPDCPIVATRPSDYPFPDLCGTGVVQQARAGVARRRPPRSHAPPRPRRSRDDRRRRPARRRESLAGHRRLASACENAEDRTAGAHACRWGRSGHDRRDRCRVPPRAAHQCGRAARTSGRGAHLVLTEVQREADLLANELETLNRDRQAVEERILREAVAMAEAWPAGKRARRGRVLWDEEWHEGVIGIVASRLAERFHRPVVMIAGGGAAWKGSGRLIPRLSHGALSACSDHWSASVGTGRPQGSRSGQSSSRRFPRHSSRTLTQSSVTWTSSRSRPSTRSCPRAR